jgi:hypothetical protein
MQATCLEEDSMKLMSWVRTVSFSMVALGALAVAGCGGAGAKGPDAGKSATPAAGVSATDASCSVAENWCGEHGVPEDICAQCNAKVAAEYKQKGDWCKEHNRPESQCFLCNSKLQAKFAAEYEAKYGKKPPKPEGT